MNWNDKIKEAIYTSPSGKSFPFGYDAGLTSETDLKTCTFTFPEKDGALVVPLGIGGRRFSFTCFFYGDSCLEESQKFEEGLKERGYGSLQHPLYGTHKVVPTGTIKRSDDLVNGISVSTVEVTFSVTLDDSSPVNSEVVTIDSINRSMDDFTESATQEFAQDVQTKDVKGLVWLAGVLRKGLKTVSDAIESIARGEKSIYTAFQTVYSEAVTSIGSVADSVLDVAFQTVKILRLPSTMAVDALAKVEGYTSAAKSIIKQFGRSPFNVNNVKNQWASTRLFLESIVSCCASGIAISSSKEDGQFKSRDDAINCATAVMSLYDEVVEYEESFVRGNLFVETGGGYSCMRDVVSLSVQQIVSSSFGLPGRKTMVLDSARSAPDLVYELYGSLDRLDEFILDNNISYNEMELIPMGREVSYYG